MRDVLPRLRELSSKEREVLLAKLIERRNSFGRVAPLSFAQQRLWFLEQFVEGNPYYNETSVLHFPFPVEAQLLKTSLNEIVSRHEALRTVFEPTEGEPRQRVLPSLELGLKVLDFGGVSAERREAEILRDRKSVG
jgi:hypothetical protein